jgi:hypothetical protein
MSQSSDSSTRALATLVTALGITIGATPATLRAQSPASAPAREAVQSKHSPTAEQNKVSTRDAVQQKGGTQAKDALRKKGSTQSEGEGDDDEPTVATRKAPTVDKAAVQQKVGTPANAPAAAPAKPF